METLTRDELLPSTTQRRTHPKGAPKHSPNNVSTVGLRLSPRLDELRRRKKFNEDLNHVGFLTTFQTPEEENELQETLTFKESVSSNHKL